MNDNKKDELGTINFLDFDSKSGKIVKIEDDELDNTIPDVETEDRNTVQMTKEQEELVKGTYAESLEAQRKAEEDAKLAKEKSNAKTVLIAIVALVVIILGCFSYFLLDDAKKSRIIDEKTQFLVDNADYANDIKKYFKDLVTNASNYQKGNINEASMINIAENEFHDIEKSISNLKNVENQFKIYEATEIYDSLLGRLNEARNLSIYQYNGGESLTVAYKTNEFVVNENRNSESYEKIFKNYLDTNNIPYTESNGQLIYTTDDQISNSK